jgi:hypothetical protein
MVGFFQMGPPIRDILLSRVLHLCVMRVNVMLNICKKNARRNHPLFGEMLVS